MAYSGTQGTTVINVQTVIDHAVRRCGKLAEETTSEQQVAARENLYFLLSGLINRGIQYWCISKEVVGLTANKYQYTLPAGAVDTLNVQYRTLNRPSGSQGSSTGNASLAFDNDTTTYTQQSAPNGNISIIYGANNTVYAGSIGVLPYVAGGGSATWTFKLQFTVDGTAWSDLEDVGATLVTDNRWLWYDIDPGQNCAGYRILASGGTTLALREFFVGNNSTEIPMSRLNRDDYTNLPNKNFTANQPFQFWFDRTIPEPTLYLWPVPSNPFVQMVVWYSRQVMDVGSLTDELEIPQRWYEAIIYMLAHRMSLELPTVQMDRAAYLEKMADKYLFEAEQEERDKSPIYFAPNISVYTR